MKVWCLTDEGGATLGAGTIPANVPPAQTFVGDVPLSALPAGSREADGADLTHTLPGPRWAWRGCRCPSRSPVVPRPIQLEPALLYRRREVKFSDYYPRQPLTGDQQDEEAEGRRELF